MLRWWACRTSAATTCCTTAEAGMVGMPHQRCHSELCCNEWWACCVPHQCCYDVLHDGQGCDGGHAAQALPQQTMLQRMVAVPHQCCYDVLHDERCCDGGRAAPALPRRAARRPRLRWWACRTSAATANYATMNVGRAAPVLLRRAARRPRFRWWMDQTSAATVNYAAMVGVLHQRCHDVLHSG